MNTLVIILISICIFIAIKYYSRTENSKIDSATINPFDLDKKIENAFLKNISPVKILDILVKTTMSETKPVDESILHFFTCVSVMFLANIICKQENELEFRDNCIEILFRIKNNSKLSNLFLNHYLIFQKGVLVFELKNKILLTNIRIFPCKEEYVLAILDDVINEWKFGIIK